MTEEDRADETTLSSFLPSTPKGKGFCFPHSLVYFFSAILNFLGAHQTLIDGKDIKQLLNLLCNDSLFKEHLYILSVLRQKSETVFQLASSVLTSAESTVCAGVKQMCRHTSYLDLEA